MSETFDDLKKLAEMRDGGEITNDEYEVVKAELLAELKPGKVVEQVARDPGWYDDPEGKHTYQAYWDGEKWTGATRSRLAVSPSRPAKRSSSVGKVVLFGVLGFVVLVGALGALGSLVASEGGNDAGQGVIEHDRSALDSESDLLCPGTNRHVRLYLWGTNEVNYADLTWATPDGGTAQDSPDVPIRNEGSSEPGWDVGCYQPGQFFHFSAQKKGQVGDIQCQVAIDGVIVSDNTSSGGEYAIVVCSGLAP